ncbi:MAG: Gfo/Idh/MocA family oxidoreductase, partial [Burkholderiales bacterium]|nr:Gfo/Idh/MocA family oxidoreductase [Burkholderiales bacterium]
MIDAAIVGLGWWGKTVVESVAGVSEDIRFVAGATGTLTDDISEFADQHGIRMLSSYDEVLKDPDVDAVVLVTPNSQHSPQSIAAAEHGKHVFCEKPFAMSKAEAEAT